FVEDYNQYWWTYFDPIALRLQLDPKRLRLETVILPLIDNSVYTGMARTFGGAPEHLDALPLPKRTIFSVTARLNKRELLKQIAVSLRPDGVAPGVGAVAAAPPAALPGTLPWGALPLAGGKEPAPRAAGVAELGVARERVKELGLQELFEKGLGNQVGLHICD